MRKVIQSLLLIAALGLLAVGCDKNYNPVGLSPKETDLSANTPNAPSILGNRVWHDLNENGLQDDTLIETGFSGVTVELYSGSGVKLTTVVTNSKGIYFFPMLAAGTYSVKFTAPQGYRFSSKDAGADTLDSDADPVTGQTAIINLPASTADLTWDAGLYEGQLEEDTVVNGTVTGKVWYDADNDGIQNETLVDTVVKSVQVELFGCDETPVATTSTGDDGGYQFTNIVPGQYYVVFTAPEGYEFSPPDATDDTLDSDADVLTGNTVCFQVDSAEAEAYWDAGLYLPPPDTVVNGRIGGRVWYDANGDGIQNDVEANEVVGSLPVALFTCAGVSVGSGLTGAAGEYEFVDIVPGEYYVAFTLPEGYRFSPMDASTDSLDSDANGLTGKTICFQADSAAVETNWDAGIGPIPQATGCTHTIGYWKNHAGFGPQEDLVTPLLPLWLGNADGIASIAVPNARTAVAVLQMKFYGGPFNGITRLYARLLTAKLNIAAGADGSAVAEVIAAADNFLGGHTWRSWWSLSKTDRKQVLRWTTVLMQYNSGRIGPGACDAYIGNGHDYDDGGGHDGDDGRDDRGHHGGQGDDQDDGKTEY